MPSRLELEVKKHSSSKKTEKKNGALQDSVRSDEEKPVPTRAPSKVTQSKYRSLNFLTQFLQAQKERKDKRGRASGFSPIGDFKVQSALLDSRLVTDQKKESAKIPCLR
jgi:hypothetical protein